MAANIDHAIASANEVISSASQLQHVAGVHETICVRDGSLVAYIPGRDSRRSDPKRSVFNFQVEPPALFSPIKPAGKPAKSIAHIERDARLRRGEGVGDLGLRIEGAQMVQNGLIRDFSRQANISRCDLARGRAHQSSTPMRRSSGDMGDSLMRRRGSENPLSIRARSENTIDAAGEHRTQEDLESAITPNVVEGAPNNRAAQGAARSDGAGTGSITCAPPSSVGPWCRK